MSNSYWDNIYHRRKSMGLPLYSKRENDEETKEINRRKARERYRKKKGENHGI